MVIWLFSWHYHTVSSFCCSVNVTGIFLNNLSTKPLYGPPISLALFFSLLSGLLYTSTAARNSKHSSPKLWFAATTTIFWSPPGSKVQQTCPEALSATWEWRASTGRCNEQVHELCQDPSLLQIRFVQTSCSDGRKQFLHWKKYTAALGTAHWPKAQYKWVFTVSVLFIRSINCFLSRAFSISLNRAANSPGG